MYVKICDICHKEMRKPSRYGGLTIVQYTFSRLPKTAEWSGKKKMDVCQECFSKICEYINKENE